MASSLFLLLDDIATLLDDIATMTQVAARQGAAAADDVAAMTQVAARKTAGVLGDDLALNAQQVTGVSADRELPVVWAVAKGSLLNKAILVPAALLISAVLPGLIAPLLMAGGLFLCFEGAEKLLHAWLHSRDEDEQHHQALLDAVQNPQVDLLAYERDKVKGAIRTDFILSAEIIVITLGIVADASLPQQLLVLSAIAVVMTLGVYGLVGAIVKIDDAGLALSRLPQRPLQVLGRGLVRLAPWLMKALSVLGTVAMFLVGGGILLHGIPAWGHALEALFAGQAPWLAGLGVNLSGALLGLGSGALLVGLHAAWQRVRGH